MGIINLPAILASDTTQINSIPVMLLFDLIDALLDRAEEGDQFDDERLVCRHTCAFMEWALVVAQRFVRKHRQRREWGVIGFLL